MSSFVTAAELRDYVDVDATTGRASDANLAIVIGWASDLLERATGRIITASASNTTRTFSSFGREYLTIPDLRVVDGMTLQSTALVADTSYHLIPSPQNPEIFTGVQLAGFGSDYRSNPEWFDRNLDQPYWRNRRYSIPNDLVISGLWGWAYVPAEWKLATLALAGYGYKRPDSLLANVAITPEGNVLNYGEMPPEVRELVEAWRLPKDTVVSG